MSRSLSRLFGAPGFGAALVTLAAFGAALAFALFVLPGSAEAGSTDLAVTKTADTNDGACTQSDCSLREAIIASNTSGADSIELPAGAYKLTREGTGEDFADTGDLDIRRGITIRPQQNGDNVTIDANGIDRVFDTPFQGTSTPYTVSIFGVEITGGVAGDVGGGGIFHNARDATLNLTESTVSNNSSPRGGGINIATTGGSNTTTIRRSTITGNEASGGQGGGIENQAGTLTLENTTVSGNQSNIGGGILNSQTLRITDSTVAFNTAQNNSGGIYASSGATLKNTIVSNNKSGVSKFAKNCSDPVTSEGNNLENGASCGFNEPTDVNADPKLGKLKDNGGLTSTHALGKGSPAIDAGGDPFPATDQRGVTRPQGAANDIGAFEKEQQLNVVLCPTGGSSFQCVGTIFGDALVGRDADFDQIQGGEGDDTYNGKGSCDAWDDASLESSDLYLVSVEDFCNNGISFLSIQDDGGKKDTIDLSRFYESTDFVFSRQFTTLYLDGPGVNDIGINDFFTPDGGKTDSIESFKFSDKTLTAKKVRKITDQP